MADSLLKQLQPIGAGGTKALDHRANSGDGAGN
jgi:hypothetical protein